MQTFPRRLGVAVVMAVIVWFLSVKLTMFRDDQIAEVALYVPAVAGLTVLTGLSGQISLGNGAFMAIGGYTTALLLLHLNCPSSPRWWCLVRSRRQPGASSGWPRRGCAAPPGGRDPLSASRCRPWPPPTRGLRGDQGLNVTFTAPAFLGATFPLTRWQGLGRHGGGAGQPAPAGEPVLQQGRPELGAPCGTTRRRPRSTA